MGREDCVNNDSENIAVLHREHYTAYRANGIKHISGNGGRRAVYDSIMTIRRGLERHKPEGKLEKRNEERVPWTNQHAEGYTFKHFAVKAGKPYPNEAHHMIPIEFFSSMLGKNEVDILRKIDYNVNNGENIIFLPQKYEHRFIHMLPVHFRIPKKKGHPEYSTFVKTEAARLRQRLQKGINEDSSHTKWSPSKDIVAELKSLQKALWNFAVRMVGLHMSHINDVEKQKLAPNAAPPDAGS
ncbi:AHH domain-containing protein [Sorangium sp. So ce131]|uniref:AHH domain-containing protein n=1 Tax=Sorangium sp. So ce131 TaxID=3133282 RepID=UPI003F5FD92C